MSTAEIPYRSLDQRHAALAEGNRRRAMRSQRKHLWRRGTQQEAIADCVDLLESPPEWAATWKVWDALMAFPRFGVARVAKLSRRVGFSPVKTLGGLTDRQRMALTQALLKTGQRAREREPRDRTHDYRVCPDCSGRMTRGARRCMACTTAYRLAHKKANPRHVCPACGAWKHDLAKMCWDCRYGKPHPGALL